MRSLVNWALLGLIIDRPSYAYELAHRFERTYEGALNLSSVSHIYVALGALQQREYIEEIPNTRQGRQPKPHYRATAAGMDLYCEWLVTQVDDDRQRQRLFVLQLAALARSPEIALEVVDRVEATCLEQAAKSPLSDSNGEGETTSGLVKRLITEEHKLALGARLTWIQYARQQLRALQGQGP